MYINFQKKIYVEKFLIFLKIISRGNKEGAGSVKFYNIHEDKRILNICIIQSYICKCNMVLSVFIVFKQLKNPH